MNASFNSPGICYNCPSPGAAIVADQHGRARASEQDSGGITPRPAVFIPEPEDLVKLPSAALVTIDLTLSPEDTPFPASEVLADSEPAPSTRGACRTHEPVPEDNGDAEGKDEEPHEHRGDYYQFQHADDDGDVGTDSDDDPDDDESDESSFAEASFTKMHRRRKRKPSRQTQGMEVTRKA